MTPEQEEFIQRHHHSYGYPKIIETRSIWSNAVKTTNSVPIFSDQNHNVYGWDGTPFGFRDSPNSIFYATYGKPTQSSLSLADAVDAALQDISKQYGTVSLLYTETMFSRGLRFACQQNKVDFEDIVISLEGHPGYIAPPTGARHFTVSQSEFLDFADNFGRITLCREPHIMFRALAGDLASYPIIYPTSPLTLSNMNFDRGGNTICGPTYWVFQEQEDDYALHQYMHFKQNRGVPSLWKYTPDVMAGWFNSNVVQDTVATYDGTALTNNRGTIRLVLREAFRFPRLRRVGLNSLAHAIDYPELTELQMQARYRAYLASLDVTGSRYMSHSHSVPFNRLLDHLGLHYTREHGKYVAHGYVG